ncbi:hypothetical protein H9X85_06355 [Anaerotignum lactatifermentans]|uniref:Lipoprotein n=1 Tax=Anaerotignum lactatifermentans TaxID=160404 RepID=A0ABS2G7Q1_9FIRM|nr:DUF6612 family protein [Anaerotignum lactatifermentans]MBM6829259.1 hypothetical protein [Anaerotignum lactatifermentans]MBM6877501.1 hypothetical protein [Anaerotignum lactatifermentans]MBM6950837.1 hypothetical protein [Anaerotignum lactatifermentans]
MTLRKKLFAGFLAGAMALTMAGCGSTSANTSADTSGVEALLQKAEETMAGVTSMSSQMDMVIDMTLEDETFSTATTANIEGFYDPVKMKMDMTLSINGEEIQNYGMYVLQDGDTLTSYMDLGGAWYAQPVDLGSISQYDAQQNMNLYLENLQTFSEAGTEEVNGKSATIIAGVLTGDSMKEAIASSGIESMSGEFGMTEEELNNLFESLGDMPVRLWITDDGYVVKYELDMTEMMASLMSSMGTEDTGGIAFTKTMVSMTCDNFNAVEDFVIPADALAAESLA